LWALSSVLQQIINNGVIVIKQEVRTPKPNSKKLFEWNPDEQQLNIVVRENILTYQLSAGRRFVFKDTKPKKKINSE
jgi:hypothetical protein